MADTVFRGVFALELAGGQAPGRAALSQEEAGTLAVAVGRDLARLVPDVASLDLVLAAAHFDPAEALRPGWSLHRRLEELHMRAPGRNQGPRVVAFGTDADGDVPLPLQADPALTGGGLRVLPFILAGEPQTLAVVAGALEESLLPQGMAGADTALLAQDGFRARIEHARYLSAHDLAAMMAMQYDNQGLSALWNLIEAALLAPGSEEWLDAGPEPLLRLADGEARMALFDPAGWCAHYHGGTPGEGECERLQRLYELFLARQRQLAAVLEAHGIPVLYVHANGQQDARALLSQAA
ncbi:hypothetical protein EIM48_04495 [Pseudoxanthomonas sp. SGNA-20]|uniref:hypothetical protein n=1 Tax=unclassified Pseudoxanthomonas TaxID=2645906 RepID=UPI0002DD2901|nr:MULTISPECIES: hypothetical protein [unclassified Pseudoxanthomonas]RRN59291.1 hypothetical protein EIM48_04495 [Pseudoxanthomonas sp. SGNA-20]RRN78965.1 hypothetical protein EIM50_12205 [Pseudoxanthomonas sp. SGD-10]